MPRKTSSVVGSAQCRSSRVSTTGCARAPAITQLVSAANCRRRNSSGAKIGLRSGGTGMSRSGASKGTFSAGSSLISARVFSRSESRRSAGTSAPPNRWRPHSAIGCSGVFCKSCEQLHSTQVCGVSRSRAWNSSMSRDLPIPGSPTISTNWPSPCRARSQRRISMAISSSRPTSGVRWRCPARRPPPLARTSRNSVTGSGTPLSSWLPRSSATNKPAI